MHFLIFNNFNTIIKTEPNNLQVIKPLIDKILAGGELTCIKLAIEVSKQSSINTAH